MVRSVTRPQSVITRLTLMVAAILVAAVLLVGGLALLGQYRQLRQALLTKAATLAQYMAEVSPLGIISLNFVQLNNDAKKVVLTDEEAVYAIMLNEQRIPLVYFFKDADPLMTQEARDLARERMPLLAAEALKRSRRIVEVTSPVSAGERQIGLVTLGFSMEKMRQALLLQVLAIGATVSVIIASSITLLQVTLRRFLRPVQALTAAATQISKGDLDVVLTATERSDEVGVLCRAFQSMTRQLRGLILGLEQREHDLHRLTLFQRAILDHAAYGIIATTPEGMVTSFNSAAERLLGYSPLEVIGLKTPELWHDPDELKRRALELSGELDETVPPGFQALTARPRRGFPEEREWSFIRKDGTRVPVLFTVTALLDDDGAVTGFVGLAYDLTERKRADEERRENEARYRRIVDTAIEGICTLTPEATITFVNARMTEILGHSRAELMDRPFADFMLDEDVPDHLARMENRRRGLSETYERRFRRKNGEVVWTLGSAAPVYDDRGTFLGSFGMFTDITERKIAEEELRHLKDDLEQRVRERTAELNGINSELERMNKVFVGRELKMVELKERIRELEREVKRNAG